MLNEFRSTYITWDKATSRIYSPVTANASDENGRKLVVQIVNSGQVEDLTGAALHLYWETRDKAHDGLDVFKAVDLEKGEFELSYTTGMLSNQGVLNANLVLIDTVGRVVSERFKITVTEGIDNDAIQSENSFSSLTQALIDISNLEQNYAPRLNDLTAQLQQTVKKDDAGVLGLNVFDEPTRNILQGQAPGTINAVLGVKNVKPINTSFLTLVEDVNEIYKAPKATSLQEFTDSMENIYLKDYRISSGGTLTTDTAFDTLKLFVEPGDVIRSKTFFYRLRVDESESQLYYASFFREDGSHISTELLRFPLNANTNWGTLKDNGLIAPEGTAFCYINLHQDYWYQKSAQIYNQLATNGKEAEVITVNKDRTYTDFNEIGILPNYIPKEAYYAFDEDVKIRKYDEALGDIKSVLATLVEVS